MPRGFSLAEAETVCGLSRRQARTLCTGDGPVEPSVQRGGDMARVRLDHFDLVKLACLSQMAAITGGAMRGPWVHQVASAVEVLRGTVLEEFVVVWDQEGANPVRAGKLPQALSVAPAAAVIQPHLVEATVAAKLSRQLGIAA